MNYMQCNVSVMLHTRYRIHFLVVCIDDVKKKKKIWHMVL